MAICPPRAVDRRRDVIDRIGATVFPDFLVPRQIEDWGTTPVTFGFEQQARCLAAARYAHLASCFTKSFVDRVNRQTKAARDGFGIVTAYDQPKGLLLLFSQRPKVCGCRRVHIPGA